MNVFDYIRPTSVAEAVAAAAHDDTVFLAGGTNLLDLMKLGVATPGRVVDISRLAELDTIDIAADGSIRVGTLVRNADLARDPAFRAAAPMVAEALLSGASAQLRNVATVGGNLMQSTRCAYFNDPHSACNRREPGAGCDALGGDTRSSAVLGWTNACIATHPSDFCVALAALDASVEIAGPAGTRTLSLDALYRLPGETTAAGSALERGELITALHLPAGIARFAPHARYLKVRERTSFAFALVSAAAALTIEAGVIADARIAIGGVAARPWRAYAAETALIGAIAEPEALERAGTLALSEARASGDNAHKITLAARTVTRALTLAAAGTPERMPALPASVFATAN